MADELDPDAPIGEAGTASASGTPLDLSDIPIDAHSHVLVVRGEVDLFGAPEFKQRLAHLIDRGVSRLVIDLSETAFLDSTAVGVVLGARRRLQTREGELVIVNLRPRADNSSPAAIFEITGLDQILTVVSTRAEAIAIIEGGSPREPDQDPPGR